VSNTPELVIGTRGSDLALRQAEIVRALVSQALPECTVTVKVIKTLADRDLGTSLRRFPNPGVFVKELERALLDREITVAVHSLKDVPSELPEGLCLAAFPQREDPRDVLVSRGHRPLAELPPGALVGTGSPRRQAQLWHLRPDLRFTEVRGNLATRLRKLQSEELTALVLAAAGLHRSGQEAVISEYLPVDVCVPAAGQGALALETRQDEPLLAFFQSLTDAGVEAAVRAERQVLADLRAGCTTPLGVYAIAQGRELLVRAALASSDGKRLLQETVTGRTTDPEESGHALAAQLRASGADDLLQEEGSAPGASSEAETAG
jgi:hydroxymethylbilane synthase